MVSRLTLRGILGRRARRGPEADGGLERMARLAGDRVGSVELDLRIGHPLQAFLDAVDGLGADLVVVARPGESRGGDGLAERVARLGTASVLLV